MTSDKFPVSTQRRFDVYTTSITLKRRRMNVKTTLCAYWVMLKTSFGSFLSKRSLLRTSSHLNFLTLRFWPRTSLSLYALSSNQFPSWLHLWSKEVPLWANTIKPKCLTVRYCTFRVKHMARGHLKVLVSICWFNKQICDQLIMYYNI